MYLYKKDHSQGCAQENILAVRNITKFPLSWNIDLIKDKTASSTNQEKITSIGQGMFMTGI
jgi:hypothetical protein